MMIDHYEFIFETRLGSRLYPTTLRGKIYRQKLSRLKVYGSESGGGGVQRNYMLLFES